MFQIVDDAIAGVFRPTQNDIVDKIFRQGCFPVGVALVEIQMILISRHTDGRFFNQIHFYVQLFLHSTTGQAHGRTLDREPGIAAGQRQCPRSVKVVVRKVFQGLGIRLIRAQPYVDAHARKNRDRLIFRKTGTDLFSGSS